MRKFKVKRVPKESNVTEKIKRLPKEAYEIDPELIKELTMLYQTYQIRSSHLGFMVEVKHFPADGLAKSKCWTPASHMCPTVNEALSEAINEYGCL